MTAAAVAEWDNEYARLARVAASQLRTTGIVPAPDAIRSLQLGLQRLLADTTDSSVLSVHLPPSEIQRRQRLVQHLQQSCDTAANAAVNSTGSMGGFATSGNPQQQQQTSKMSMAMRQQDDMIDQLAVGVHRLKQQSATIGEEANMQVHLMTDMDANLDLAQASLQNQTQRAASLRQEQSLWRLQLIVAGLTVLLVLEIMWGLQP